MKAKYFTPERYNIVLREQKMPINEGILLSSVGRFSILQLSIYPPNCRFNAKSLLLCQKGRKLQPKIYMEPQGPYLPKTILIKE